MATVVIPVVPALGHAFGDPPRAWMRADGEVVIVDWVAAEDDAAAIGHAIGLLPVTAMWAFIEDVPEELPTSAQRQRLSEAPELRAYLLEHIRIEQDGRPCPGEVEPAADFIADGARLRFRCPQPVEQALVRITLLLDQDASYRTFSVDASDQLAVHSAARPEHLWDFTRSASGPTGIDAPLIGGLLLVALASVGALRLVGPRERRTRARSRSAPADPGDVSTPNGTSPAGTLR